MATGDYLIEPGPTWEVRAIAGGWTVRILRTGEVHECKTIEEVYEVFDTTDDASTDGGEDE